MPQLNTTSTADISFMLLIFFLVCSSMDVDKGMERQLPPLQTKTEQPSEAAERNVMKIVITAGDSILQNDNPVSLAELRRNVAQFVANPSNRADLPEKTVKTVALLGKYAVADHHIISVECSRDADYATYFAVQNELVGVYSSLRNQLAQKRFHHSLGECSEEEKKALGECYPQRISEVYNTNEEGGAK